MASSQKKMKHKKTVCSIIDCYGEVLLLKRGSTAPWYGSKHSFVCGLIEKGEKPMETAYREIEEETGLKKQDLELVKNGKLVIVKDKNIGITWHVRPFLFKTFKSAVKINWENSEYVWAKPEDLFYHQLCPGMLQHYIQLLGDLPQRKGVLGILYSSPDFFLLVKTSCGNVVFPSGGIEPGETELEALAHEVKEETGIIITEKQAKKLPLKNEFTHRKGFLKGVKGTQTVYLIKVGETVKIKPTGDDVVWARWFSRAETRKMLIDDLKILFGQVLEYIDG